MSREEHQVVEEATGEEIGDLQAHCGGGEYMIKFDVNVKKYSYIGSICLVRVPYFVWWNSVRCAKIKSLLRCIHRAKDSRFF